MSRFWDSINHPAEAFNRGDRMISWILVGITVLLNIIVEPIAHLIHGDAVSMDLLQTVVAIIVGFATYGIICGAFWLICKVFGSQRKFKEYIDSWGITLLPTAICTIIVVVTEVYFDVFWNSTILGMLLNFVYIGILIWKTILYFIYLISFAGLKGWRCIAAAVFMGIVILVMASVDGRYRIFCPVI